MEERFRQAIAKKYGQDKTNKHLLSKEDYYRTIEDIKTAKKGTTKSRHQYHVISR